MTPSRVLESAPNGRAIPSRQNLAITVPAVTSIMAGTRQPSPTLRRTTVQHALGRRTQCVPRHRLEPPYLHPRPSNPSHHGVKLHFPDSLLCVSKNIFCFTVLSLHLIVGDATWPEPCIPYHCHHRTSLWTVFEQHNYSHLSTSMHTPEVLFHAFIKFFFFFFAHSQTFVACHSAVFDPYIYVSPS